VNAKRSTTGVDSSSSDFNEIFWHKKYYNQNFREFQEIKITENRSLQLLTDILIFALL
jgi:hypothetical protein